MLSRRSLLATQAAGLWLSLADGWLRPVAAQPDATPLAGPLAPWQVAPHADPRIAALAWAVLAPNPHNRQPWLMRLIGSDTILLHVDLERRLPVTDPLDRQILIGLGCFTELLRLAAAQQGIAAEISAFPEGEPQPRLDTRPIARITFRGAAAADPLFAAAATRRSAKQPFDMAREVPDAALTALRAALLEPRSFGARNAAVEAIRDLVWQAWLIEAATEAAHRESVDLMRLGTAEVTARPDGISLWGPALDPMVARGELTRAAMLAGQPGHGMMVGQYRAMLAATNAYVWLTTPGQSRADQFAAGRDWLRLNLAANRAGLALHPVSQALQEYPEMAGPRAALPALLAAAGEVQMLGRLGHATRPTGPTPRWPVESRILG
ncbi:hypothetical protein [Sediminicoccus sp. KRV36]|uniref:Acg family FMN-binding oxidoreductase n=1 Tax=Sediminicoccus sp. KRV36 TaxID=3133721 RepID=UPI00200FF0DF|nr:hypothetical protein [Sediminicoccus rosea]UPY37399.1 hypothetical protein LHU95_01540 [Sediminicoccus rosea]